MQTVRVKVTRAFYYDRTLQEVGRRLELPKQHALEFSAAGKVEMLPDDAVERQVIARERQRQDAGPGKA